MDCMSEVDKLKAEKEALLEKSKEQSEVKKLKKEIFFLKNPIFTIAGNIGKGIFNTLGNIGDMILKSVSGAKKPKPQPYQQPQYSNETFQTKPKPHKPKPQTKPKGVEESINEVINNLDKEINKFDL